MYSVGRAIFDEQGEKCKNAAHKEGNAEEIDDEEDGKAATHDC